MDPPRHGSRTPRTPCRVRLYGAAESGRVVEALPIDHGNILDKCVMFGSVWRLCSCGQWHANRKPTRVHQCRLNAASALSFPTTLRLACSHPTWKTSRMSLCATSFIVAQIPPVRPSRCVAAHREHRWDCVEEAAEHQKKKERLREAASHNQSTVQRRTADPHKEDKPMEDLRIHPTIQATTELNKSSLEPANLRK